MGRGRMKNLNVYSVARLTLFIRNAIEFQRQIDS